MKFKNKVAVITGSSRGIGKATALLFAQKGAKVVVNCRTDRKRGCKVVDEIKKFGHDAVFIQADVSKSEGVKKLFQETIKVFGTVDILVNNAGIIRPKPFLELSAEDLEKTFSTNVIGVFLCAQEAAKIMLKKKQGKIINIASMRGLPHCGREGIMGYSVSKAAVINFTKTLAKELAPHINVNAVAPGFTETEMTKVLDENTRQSVIEDTYLKRFIQPEEIAKAVLYLASDDANAVTGEVLVIDSGYSLK